MILAIASKRSGSDQPSPKSKLTINDLPEPVLVDILCRVPDSRVVYQCKLVSKRWRTLLSDPYFVMRFLSIQHGQQKPLLNRYVMIPTVEDHKTLVLNISSEPNLPPLEAQSISSIFPVAIRRRGHEVHVKGTYNDLVLCTQDISERVYYVCNCYTKEWIRLPPTAPRRYSDIKTTGFICEPYYSFKEEGTSCNSSNKVKLHADYRFRVVRLITTLTTLTVEIFYSETGKWREYSLSSQRQRFPNYRMSRGIACNGKLYWLTYEGSVLFELDPFNLYSTASDDDVIDSCRFIESPTPYELASYWYIGVCRGRLHSCQRFILRHDDPMVIWELKENEVSGKPEWCLLHRMCLSEMICKQPFTITHFYIVGFHPIDQDIVYLQHRDRTSEPGYVVMCNVRENTLIEIAMKIPSDNSNPAVSWVAGQIFASVIPWWPTPVPTRLNFREEDINITAVTSGVDMFTLKVGSLSTVERLKQELQEKGGRWLFNKELRFDGRVLDDDYKLITDYGIKDSSNIMVYVAFPYMDPRALRWFF